jgi:hypothetical protein
VSSANLSPGTAQKKCGWNYQIAANCME